jgi:hypothetical protein
MSKSNMIYQYDDHNLVDQEVRSNGITYVLARPVRLAEGGAIPVTEWSDNGKDISMMASITRESVAKWLSDAALTCKGDNTYPVISN